MTDWWLLGDIGGTNARLAVSEGAGRVGHERAYGTQRLASLDAALADYLASLPQDLSVSRCRGARIAAAGPVEGNAVKLTNAQWHIRGEDVSARIGGAPAIIVNDLEAVAALLPHLAAGDVRMIGDAPLSTGSSHAVAINLGTGLGAAAVVKTRCGQWLPIGGEPGHFSFAVSDADDAGLLAHATTFEDYLSGRGVGHLYDVVAALAQGGDGAAPASHGLSAEGVFAAAASDPIAQRCVRQVSRMLGRFAGDLVLATAAWDGAFLCGSVVGGWAAVCDTADFRVAFEAKGAMSSRMRGVPSAMILTPDPALIGLTHLGADA